jgi:hypothetical protein
VLAPRWVSSLLALIMWSRHSRLIVPIGGDDKHVNRRKVGQVVYGLMVGDLQNLITSRSTAVLRESDPAKPPTHAVLGHYAWRHHCRGLFQMPIAAQFNLRIRHGQA